MSDSSVSAVSAIKVSETSHRQADNTSDRQQGAIELCFIALAICLLLRPEETVSVTLSGFHYLTVVTRKLGQ